MTPSVTLQALDELKDMMEKMATTQTDATREAGIIGCLTDKVVEIARVQSVVVEQLKEIVITTDKISLTVYGNGKPGLTTLVAQMTKDVETVMNIVRTVAFTLLGLGVTALFYLVLSHGIIR